MITFKSPFKGLAKFNFKVDNFDSTYILVGKYINYFKKGSIIQALLLKKY